MERKVKTVDLIECIWTYMTINLKLVDKAMGNHKSNS